MRIYVMSVFVDDQAKALDFYTVKLGFIVKHDIPLGEHRWLTVVSKEAPEGTELLLEPGKHPAVGPYKSALVSDGIPAASFKVDDLQKEFERLRDLGVKFTTEPMDAGAVRMAVLMIPAATSFSSSRWSKESESCSVSRVASHVRYES